MSMPGFTADASSTRARGRYASASAFASRGVENAIQPQVGIIASKSCKACGGTIKDGKCNSDNADSSMCITANASNVPPQLVSALQFFGFLES